VKRLVVFLVLFLCLIFSLCFVWVYWREHSQDRVILAAARQYSADPALIKAIVWRESWFNPKARGRVGEMGLMQLREAAAGEWAATTRLPDFTVEHLFNARTNVLVGTWYLQKLLKRYGTTDNPVPYALADYNAGRANVLKWNKGAAATNSASFIDQIGFPSTRRYVRAVMKRRDLYGPAFPTNQVAASGRIE
jgi:soluble lytic murein transglycosylase